MTMTLSAAYAFVTREAALLDSWKTEEWASLFAEHGEYLVPSLGDPEGAPDISLFLICDDHDRLTQRAIRLLKRTAHAEYPHSTTTRVVSNVRVSTDEDGDDRIDCTFVVYRSRADKIDIYPGRSVYKIVWIGGIPKIARKTAILGLEQLRPQGKLSIIL